ncbi:hypothetical protein [Hymenobacter terrenus]|uniref:hypothetical protein n=1 Tax=Hymenobacter terrenus TaxID=1629124 RepID=UPI00061925FC|nr:hypothetical protein [Hymenobacter terrenus]
MSPADPLRFLVDAQLPRRLADFLAFHIGGDCLHTLDLPAANQTQEARFTSRLRPGRGWF